MNTATANAPSIYQYVPTSLRLSAISKSYSTKPVLENIELDVTPGEFVCLLGPSGCGKTTLLRIIAGLEQQNNGQILVENQDISHTPAQHRDYGILFQSYALFPNLTAAKNVAYGLHGKQLSKTDIQQRVEDMLSLVGMSAYMKEYPDRLSGGQQQRVALARALAPSPRLLLLDEPMSALDAKVRERLRIELRTLQHELGITTVMVTHDQDEAMVMAHRIAVMNAGKIEQFDTPENIYHHPKTRFVANFIGNGNWIKCDGIQSSLAHAGSFTLALPHAEDTGPCDLFFRPESVQIFPEPEANTFGGKITEVWFQGSRYRIAIELEALPDQKIIADISHQRYLSLVERNKVWVRLPVENIRVFVGN